MSYIAGAVVRTTVTFVPESGTTALANISATAEDTQGNTYALTVAATAVADQYTADVTTPDTAITGRWWVRFESSSPNITAETTFDVVASALATP